MVKSSLPSPKKQTKKQMKCQNSLLVMPQGESFTYITQEQLHRHKCWFKYLIWGLHTLQMPLSKEAGRSLLHLKLEDIKN